MNSACQALLPHSNAQVAILLDLARRHEWGAAAEFAKTYVRRWQQR